VRPVSKKIFFFFLISFFISLLLRLYKINSYPPSLNWDEISHGYNAYSILKTGKDEWGKNFPLIFRAYGDYKLPLYIYLTIIPVFIFGLNPLSIRLISIIAGSLTPILTYLITQKVIPNKPKRSQLIPFIALLITMFSPWSIFLSRIALEANLFLTLFLASFYFLINKKPSSSAFFYTLCLFTYNSSRVLLPFYLLTITLNLIQNPSKTKAKQFKTKLKKHGLGFLFLFFSIIIFLSQTFNSSGQARYQWVTILDSGAINQINNLRQTYPRFLANKVTYLIYHTAKNYLSHFNPKYLFFSGGSHYQFNIQNFHLISPFFIPFFILGILLSLRRNFFLLFFFFLISPLPSAITRDAPHILRSIIFLPLCTIIISLGFYQLVLFLKNKNHSSLSILYLLTTLTFSQLQFWPKYKTYSKNYSQSWQYGYKQTIDFIKKNYSKYDQILFTKKYGEPHEFILFYWPWEPKTYQSDPNKIWDYHANWYWIDAFDKFKFINDWEILSRHPELIERSQKILLITSPDNYNKNNAKLLKTINFLDNTPAFEIISYE